jgi:hypothetical protein
MFQFNSKTAVNREFKIKDILKMVNADKDIKKDASCIEKITLSNVICKDTLNMKSDNLCREIYIFTIVLKEKKIPTDFIKMFDKVIELHTYFIFEFKNEVKELCIYRYIENDVIKRGNIYENNWHKKELKELPYCMGIKEIYDNLIFNLVGLKPVDNEEINCFLERFNNIQKLKKEINVLEKKAFKEVQPRKKFDIGREIKRQKEKLKTLEGSHNGQA